MAIAFSLQVYQVWLISWKVFARCLRRFVPQTWLVMRGSDLTMISCGWLLICSYPGCVRAPVTRSHPKCQNSDGTLRSGRLGQAEWSPTQLRKMSKKQSSQNGLRMYPELLPHQLRPISTYPNPPISHIGKIENCWFVLVFLCLGYPIPRILFFIFSAKGP